VLNPSTPTGALSEILPEVDYVLVMSVNPGFSYQKLLAPTLDKLRRLKREIAERGLRVRLQVDGGVNPANIKSVVEAGAEIVVVGTASDERQRVAEEIAAQRGLAIIPPFDDDRIIAGQGTVGLEIAEDLPDLAVVLVPVGGGGLASGVSTAMRINAASFAVAGTSV